VDSTFEPDPTVRICPWPEVPSKVPQPDKNLDRVTWNGDRELDIMLANMRKAIEPDG
jgi:hypothetical protein